MKTQPNRIEITSDVNQRDGIGIEVYRNNELVLEIFRDDTDKTRTVTTYSKDISFELMEEAIHAFKEMIPRDFIKY